MNIKYLLFAGINFFVCACAIFIWKTALIPQEVSGLIDSASMFVYVVGWVGIPVIGFVFFGLEGLKDFQKAIKNKKGV